MWAKGEGGGLEGRRKKRVLKGNAARGGKVLGLRSNRVLTFHNMEGPKREKFIAVKAFSLPLRGSQCNRRKSAGEEGRRERRWRGGSKKGLRRKMKSQSRSGTRAAKLWERERFELQEKNLY